MSHRKQAALTLVAAMVAAALSMVPGEAQAWSISSRGIRFPVDIDIIVRLLPPTHKMPVDDGLSSRRITADRVSKPVATRLRTR